MQDNHQHTDSYSAADIERYLSGKMSAAEMHSMEKAALDDPFLADAMEGYANVYQDATGSTAEDLSDLHTRLRTRLQEEKKSTALPLWKTAAAAIFIILAGSISYYFLIVPSPPGIAQKEVLSKEATINRTKDSVLPTESPKEVNEPVGVAKAPLPSANVPVVTEKEPVASAKSPVYSANGPVASARNSVPSANGPVASAKAFVPSSKESKPDDRSDSLATKPVIASREFKKTPGKEVAFENLEALSANIKKDSGVARAEAGKQLSEIVITGIVTDQKSKPVKGAFVTLQGKIGGVVTDSQGRFNLPAEDDLAHLSVASVGFEKKEVQLSTAELGNSVNIRLKPAEESLNEVVVTGYDNSKKAKKRTEAKSDNNNTELSVKTQNAVPGIGWDEFNSYLLKSKIIPDSLRQVHGNVVVAFDLNTKGKLSSFSVLQSLHPVLDAEAIRLLQQGPSWKILNGKRTSVQVIIAF
jgi:outer membrane biosynthesis protein TonB